LKERKKNQTKEGIKTNAKDNQERERMTTEEKIKK
jgi:hypothetical protein